MTAAGAHDPRALIALIIVAPIVLALGVAYVRSTLAGGRRSATVDTLTTSTP